ncbi:MAG: alpha/beta hydrolase [Actinobacteria bacterium]|nr:alpha/beta hydrolase [Actinomycetota bacterium]
MVSGCATVCEILMRWEQQGEGFPVVFVHGILTSPSLWRYVMPLVEERCMAWEMVGYGESIPQGDGRDISVARQADYLLDWLDHLGIERAVFVGHDLGGGVLQIAAHRASGRFAGIVLTNSIAYDSWPIPSVKAMRSMGGLMAHAPNAVFRALVEMLVRRGHDDRHRASESLSMHLDPYEMHGGAKAMVRQVRSLDVRDTLAIGDGLRNLDVPSGIAWGAADQFQKLRYGQRLADDLAAPLKVIEGGKHFVPEDHPQELAQVINQLLLDVKEKQATPE